MSRTVLQEAIGPVAVVTLNRPERHNSLIPDFLREILAAITAVSTSPTMRALVLQANGRSFSTGGDALGFVQHADDIETYAREIVGLLNQVILALIDLPVPVVTAVHGIVTGGALGFILGSDIVLVAPEASFTPYYSVVGPSPDGGWAGLLPLLIGPRRTAEVLYLNRTIDAETAVTWGIANRIVPADLIRAESLAIANDIAAKKPGSIRHTKRLLTRHRDELAARLDAELDHFVDQMVNGEGLAGFEEFLTELQVRKAIAD
ncbi:MAG: enoyl-CoA hydratase/isomerase family protein [Ardenticatenaceae bacterium]|nr:enoyl-CoA hydratase/isomerase family protein [Ardenticatenaceae bacterium]MCB9444399.1 enoyl-CoA hydratase/isomerase family protein [Ardenticatenaceae bacterium]